MSQHALESKKNGGAIPYQRKSLLSKRQLKAESPNKYEKAKNPKLKNRTLNGLIARRMAKQAII